MSHDNVNNNKKTGADQVNFPNTPPSQKGSKSKAKKVLLAELEELMEVLTQAESGTASQESNFKRVLHKIVNGSSDLTAADVIKAMTGTLKKDGGNLTALLKLVGEAMQDLPQMKGARKHMKTATGLMNELSRAIKDGETSLDEVVGDENFQHFLGGLMPQKKGDSFGAVAPAKAKGASSKGAAKTSDPEQSHKEALMAIAVALQKLLSTVYNNQTQQGNLYTEALNDQLASIEQTTKDKIADLKNEQNQATQTQKKPWYMYLIGAVVAVVGAVIAACTAGAGAAIVGLAVAVIMMSPVGDAITSGLTNAFLGGNTNPTDAQKTGAQIGATAVIAVITTLLTMGAGGVTTGADAAAGGVADAATASSDVASSVVDSSEGLAMEMTEMGANAGETMANQLEEEAGDVEGLVEELESEASEAGDSDSSEETESTRGRGRTNGSKKFKLGWDQKAFTTGLGKRLVGNLVTGFVGGGGLVESFELIAQTNPELKKLMDSNTGALVLAIVGALVSIGASIGSSKLLVEPGSSERSDYLEYVGKKDVTLNLNSTARTILDVVSLAAQMGNTAAAYVKMKQYQNLASTKELVASVEAALVGKNSTMQTMNSTQDLMNKGYSSEENSLTDALKQIFDTMGNDQRGTANNM